MKEPRNPLSTSDIAAAAEREEAKRRNDAPETTAGSERSATLAAERPEDLALFPVEEADGFRARWEAIQTGFVDEPKTAVAEADALVAQVVTRLAQVFSDEKGALEQQWGRGDTVSTEDLRVALKRYRAFFHRLLTV
jgi:hypothetical protein